MHRVLQLAFLVFIPSAAVAIDFEKLVMPGPLIEGHAKVESNCTSCHQPFEARKQRLLCLVCHEDVSDDIEAKAGFHGRFPSIAGSRCRDCHTDHEGRDADIVDLDPETFDHRFTDFELRGKHRSVKCSACHKEEKEGEGFKFRDAKSDCVACHKEDDPHKGRLGEKCASCHVERSFTEAKFDHDETDFPLVGKHEQVDCALCHAGERYEGTPKDCRSCHATNDVHRGEFGRDCARCHQPERWDRSYFDHGKETGFKLQNRHAKVKCRACHVGPLEEQDLDTACASCHSSDDVHRGRNGTDCASCHSTRGWARVSFNHDRDTKFPLKGEHEGLSCQSCHRADPRTEKLEMSCISCHRSDDAHAGSEGEDCGRCHNPTGWRRDVNFDHDLTRFPLLGLHAAVACESCHGTTHFRDTDTQCLACHKADDVHRKTLGPDCARCHNPNSWSLWRFDHNTETDFDLRGAHEGLNCAACHKRPVTGKFRQRSDCAACHAFDDVHDGGFGRDCGRCHNDTRWSDISIDRVR